MAIQFKEHDPTKGVSHASILQDYVELERVYGEPTDMIDMARGFFDAVRDGTIGACKLALLNVIKHGYRASSIQDGYVYQYLDYEQHEELEVSGKDNDMIAAIGEKYFKLTD